MQRCDTVLHLDRGDNYFGIPWKDWEWGTNDTAIANMQAGSQFPKYKQPTIWCLHPVHLDFLVQYSRPWDDEIHEDMWMHKLHAPSPCRDVDYGEDAVSG